MSESEAPIPSSPVPAGAKPVSGDRRRHRGRRGGRGRRGPGVGPPPQPTLPPAEPGTPTQAEIAVPEQPLAPALAPEPKPLLQRIERLTERVAAQRVAVAEPAHHGSAICQAIDEVMEVIEALKRAVDQMEEVLELVELAERQKLGDEREIDSLRRALRNVNQRPDRRGGEGRRSDNDPRRSGDATRRGGDEPRASEDESSPNED